MVRSIADGLNELLRVSAGTAQEAEEISGYSRAAMEQMEAASRAVESMAAITEEHTAATEEMRASNEHVSHSVQHLYRSAAMSSAMLTAITPAISGLRNGTGALQQRSSELSSLAEGLRQQAARLAMEEKMVRAAEYVRAWAASGRPATSEGLTQLLSVLGMDELYAADRTGVFRLATVSSILGINQLEIEPEFAKSYPALVSGARRYYATPVKRRFEDGRLYKFVMVADQTGAIYTSSLALDTVLRQL